MAEEVKSSQECGVAGVSIRVGTTGTIGNLMTKELDSLKEIHPQAPASSSSMKKPQTVPVSVRCGAIPRRSVRKRKSNNEAGRGHGNVKASDKNVSSSSNIQKKNSGNNHELKSNILKNDHDIPMLRSGNTPPKSKPNREKSEKKGSFKIAEVVDLKCGTADKPWSVPIATRLKKLSFSKLSDSAT